MSPPFLVESFESHIEALHSYNSILSILQCWSLTDSEIQIEDVRIVRTKEEHLYHSLHNLNKVIKESDFNTSKKKTKLMECLRKMPIR